MAKYSLDRDRWEFTPAAAPAAPAEAVQGALF